MIVLKGAYVLIFINGMKVWDIRNTQYLHVCLSLFSHVSMSITAFSNLNVHSFYSGGFWCTTTTMSNYLSGLKEINKIQQVYRYTRIKIQLTSVSRLWFQLLTRVSLGISEARAPIYSTTSTRTLMPSVQKWSTLQNMRLLGEMRVMCLRGLMTCWH